MNIDKRLANFRIGVAVAARVINTGVSTYVALGRSFVGPDGDCDLITPDGKVYHRRNYFIGRLGEDEVTKLLALEAKAIKEGSLPDKYKILGLAESNGFFDEVNFRIRGDWT